MKKINAAVLLELAVRWEDDAKESAVPEFQSLGVESDARKVDKAVALGMRITKRECADTIKTLVSMLGRDDEAQ